MKSFRYLAIALTIIAALAITSWALRNSLVQRISSPILTEYDIELVDISVDALATGSAKIGYLELVYAAGTTFIVEDLMLPIGTADDAIKTYSAQHVKIVATTRNDDDPFELARLIGQFLSLSDSAAGNAIQIAQLDVPSYPSIRDLRWAVSDKKQHLSWIIGSVDMSVETSRIDTDDYDVSFSLPNQTAPDDTVSSINGKLQQGAQGISIVGHSMLELSNWQGMAKLAGILPDAVDLRSGTGELRFEVEIPFEASQSPTVLATVIPASPWQIGYVGELGDLTDVLVTSGSTINIRSTFPEVDWYLQRADMSLLVMNGVWSKVPLSVNDLSCQVGPTCSMDVDIVWLNADMPIGSAAKVAISSVLEVAFPVEGVHVNVGPNASLELSGFVTPDNAINRLDARLISAATMQYEGADWRLAADSIDAEIDSFSLNSDIAIDFALYLEKIKVGGSHGIVKGSAGIFAPSIQLAFNNQSAAVPGIKGQVSLQNSNIVFDLVTVDLLRNGSVSGQHNFDGGIGDVAILDAAFAFDDAPLSKRVAPWESDFDISSGNVAVDLRANWAATDSGSVIEARSSMQIDALAGFYADIAYVGFSTDIELDFSATGITVAQTSISVDMVDIGLPIENITADIEFDVNALAIDVDNLQMTTFDGVISAAPFSFRTGRDINNVFLTAKEIELSELLSIKEFAAVNVTGTITAVLPISFAEDGISIEAGKLTGEPPGGVIRYLGGDPDSTDLSSLGLATTALSNFEYESLEADVSYSKAGDLTLQMQIKGRNPELDDGRPIVLNLGVENNVPQMLKSLQAARAVEEILEERLAD